MRNPELNRHLNLNDKIIEIQQSMFDYWRQCRKKVASSRVWVTSSIEICLVGS